MTPRQFSAALSQTRMPPDSATARAARMVLVEGLSAYAAARLVGVDQTAVGRALKRLRPAPEGVPCPHCGGSGKLIHA